MTTESNLTPGVRGFRSTMINHDSDDGTTADVLRATLHGGDLDGQTMIFSNIETDPAGVEAAVTAQINELFMGGDGDLFNLG